jgi:hypothetical protein
MPCIVTVKYCYVTRDVIIKVIEGPYDAVTVETNLKSCRIILIISIHSCNLVFVLPLDFFPCG